MENNNKNIISTNEWLLLKQHTAARIALGRTGVSIPFTEVLQFKMAHAHARDAVFSQLNKSMLTEGFDSLQLSHVLLKSRAADRYIYLQRPDLGRRLEEASAKRLNDITKNQYDVCVNVVDGLSAAAINHHAIPVLQLLLPRLHQQKLSIAPLCLIEQGRVAVGDETGGLLHAKLSLLLIGERPGLSSPNSMSAYLTYTPKIGLTDESRNCVSNIRPDGMTYDEAAEKIAYLVVESLRLNISGVMLKDNGSKLLR